LLGPAAAQVPLSFATLDENGDGVVDREEFMLFTRDALREAGEDKAFRRMVYRHADSLYKTCDTDGDGLLTQREVKYAAYLGEAAERLAKSEGGRYADYEFDEEGSSTMVAALDLDGDGLASKEEFWQGVREDLSSWSWQALSMEDARFRQWMHDTFRDADFDGDGLLDARELQFAGFLVTDRTKTVMAVNVLNALDKNDDMKVDLDEIMWGALGRMGKGKPTVRRGVMDVLVDAFRDIDLDGDGALDLHELLAFSGEILANPHRL